MDTATSMTRSDQEVSENLYNINLLKCIFNKCMHMMLSITMATIRWLGRSMDKWAAHMLY